MKNLINTRSKKLKLLKYIFLSAGCCIFVAIIITLYLKSAADEETKESLAKQGKNKLLKNYSLKINKPIFEGVTGDLTPYQILAQSVSRDLNNQYTLQEVNANYKINNSNMNAKAASATLDDSSRFVTLKNNVQITTNDIVLKCEELKLNLDKEIANSNSTVEIDFQQYHITAENFSIQKDKGTADFSGGVNITFDNLKLQTSEILVLFTNDNNNNLQIKKILIPGKLKAIHNCKTETVTADQGVYDNSTKKLTLSGNVYVQKEDNILITDKLVYSSSLATRD